MDHSLSALLCFYLYNVVWLVYFSVWPIRIMVDYVCSLLSVNDICFGIVLCLEYIESMHFLLFGLVLSLLK